jgi:hypothetical protein
MIINNEENVARVIFSPRMVYKGILQTEAFSLREHIAESYLSVLRMAIPTWQNDVIQIPQRKNRQLYGYAMMNVGEIRDANFQNVKYDVKVCNNQTMKSHAGIFITVGGEPLIGGKKLESIDNNVAQDYLLLLIQRRLVEIARKNVRVIE